MSFIENQIYFMFMNMNTKDQKVQQSQKKILRETWNSKIEEHCVKPQTQDQLKRVQANKVFNWSNELSISSKVHLFRSFQTSQHHNPNI